MTEKQYRKVLGFIEKNNGKVLDLTEIENELNQLVHENEQLKKENKELREDLDYYQKTYEIQELGSEYLGGI